jgi:hypothetical protein
VVLNGETNGFGIDNVSIFDEAGPFMEDIPDDSAQSVSDGPNCFQITPYIRFLSSDSHIYSTLLSAPLAALVLLCYNT